MIQHWAQTPFSQTINPLSTLSPLSSINPLSTLPSTPQVIQLLQLVPQQLQQLQQNDYVRHQQLQQLQQLVQYVAIQLQVVAQQQSPQASFGALAAQGLGQPYQGVGAGIPGAFLTPPLQVM